MKTIQNVLTVLLSLMVLNLICFDDVCAGSPGSKEKVTKTSPSGMSSPETPMPADEKKEQQSWISKYKWWLLGGLAIVAVGAAAAGGGGGSSGSSSGETPAGDDTGNVTVTWSD